MIFKKTSIGLSIIYVIFSLLPFLLLIFNPDKGFDFSFDFRRLELLGNTFFLAFFTASISLVLGLFLATFVANSKFRDRDVRWFFLLLAPLPSYVYALSLMNFIRFLPRTMSKMFTGMIPSISAQVFLYLPIVTAIILLGFEGLDKDLIEAGSLSKPYNKVFTKIILANLSPFLIFAASLVFIFSSTDFSIPSLFQYNVYAMDIFADFSARESLSGASLLSIPLVMLNFIPFYYMIKNLSKLASLNTKKRAKAYRLNGALGFFAKFALMLAFLQIILPLLTLVINLDLASIKEIFSYSDGYFYSVLTALMATLISIPISGASTNIYLNIKNKLVFIGLLLFPLIMPATLISMALRSLVNSSPFYFLSSSLFLPAFAMAIRLASIFTMFFIIRYYRIDKDKILVAKLYKKSDKEYFSKIILANFKKTIIFMSVFAFLISLGDINTAIVLAPAGKTVISITIFNYLHYGSSKLVSALSMLMVIINVLLLGLVLVVIGRNKDVRNK